MGKNIKRKLKSSIGHLGNIYPNDNQKRKKVNWKKLLKVIKKLFFRERNRTIYSMDINFFAIQNFNNSNFTDSEV